MRRSSVPQALTCLLAVTACHDATAPAPRDPPALGATVFHGTANFWARLSDGSYSIYVGASPTEIAEDCATGSFEGAYEWNDLTVIRPNGGVHFRDTGKEVSVVVWQEGFYEPCLGATPVFATGTATVSYTDNDATVEAPGANSFGFTGNGIVLSTGGDKYRVHFHALTVIAPDGGSFKELAKIRLTPIR